MDKVIQLLLAYRYTILLPIAIIEGPIATVIGGFFSSTGFMNPWIVYGIVIVGDVLGDLMLYLGGYWGSGFIIRHGSRFGITEKKIEDAKIFFKENHRKAIIFSKLFHGIGFTGLIAAGSLKISYKRYFRTCLWVGLMQSAFFLFLGIFFGGAYVQIGRYLNYFAAIISVIVLVIVVIVFIKRADINKKIESRQKIKDYK